MRGKLLAAILFLAFIFGYAPVRSTEMQNNNYIITNSVVSSGGAPMTSENFKANYTLGQSSATGQSSSSSYFNYAGFWQPMELKVKGRAMPWIPLLLLDE